MYGECWIAGPIKICYKSCAGQTKDMLERIYLLHLSRTQIQIINYSGTTPRFAKVVGFELDCWDSIKIPTILVKNKRLLDLSHRLPLVYFDAGNPMAVFPVTRNKYQQRSPH
jgi:hypothetical protein